MTPAERNLPDNAVDSPTWQRRFEDKRTVEVARADNYSRGRFNNDGRSAWWYGHDVDTTLHQYGYRQPAARPTALPAGGVHGAASAG